jgi:hypothetical protein
MRSAGLAHAYSGTCAIDVDDIPRAQEWLAERGVDLINLFNAPDAVQLSSGRQDHGKLIYRLPEPLCSKKVALFDKNKSALDFRCATAAGLTVQDVLPPSIHPDTGQPYKWVCDEMFADWTNVPMIPEALHRIWLEELEASVRGDDIAAKGASVEELRALLAYHDPDMNRDDWIKVGMAIHHETNGDLAGLDLWDEWSRGSVKYNDRTELETCWRSFHDVPGGVTVGSLRQGASATPDEFPDVTDQTDADDPWAAVAAEKRAKFAPVHVSAIAQRDPPEWIVDHILPKADIAMVYGAPSAGKSFLGLDLGFSVSCGFTWFNERTNAGPVVWIAAEAAGAMRNRARAYAQARGVNLETTDLHVVEQRLSLMNDDDAVALAEAISDGIDPTLIIVDTLAAASGGANENSGEDMNKVLDNCRRLHDATGALVLLIHHSGKDAARGARGWSGLNAAVRTELHVTADEDSPVRIMRISKQNDGTGEGRKLPFKLLTVAIDFDEDITSCVVEPLDEVVLNPNSSTGLRANQKLVFQCIYKLAGESPEGDYDIPIQDVYDAAVIEMPAPAEGTRDRRTETIRRSLASLHERGLIIISDNIIRLGAGFHDYED